MKLNMGCGETKLDGFINIDVNESSKPDLVHDIRKKVFPYESESVDAIYAIHFIEHVERFYWDGMFQEFRRVLKSGGDLVLAYPEFEVVAKYFIENYLGQRNFWEAVLYGRQAYPGDYHVTAVTTSRVTNILRNLGFANIKTVIEDLSVGGYHTFLKCEKGAMPLSKEEVTKRFIFGKTLVK